MRSNSPEAGRPRVIVTGADGMLGRAVAERFAATHDVIPHRRADCDLADAGATAAWFAARAPELVVHCAAWTDVDGCEADPARARRDNTDATRSVALATAAVDAALLHMSTDYVFDGTKLEPYREDDPTGPLGVYGKSKLAAEEAVRATIARAWIVRTSWLFGPGGRNFVRTIAGLAASRDEIRVVADQRGRPTYTYDLADALVTLVSRGAAFGTYHACNAGSCTWFDFATAIAARVAPACQVIACTTAEFPRPAPRPRNSVLDSTASESRGLPVLAHWKRALDRYVAILPSEASA